MPAPMMCQKRRLFGMALGLVAGCLGSFLAPVAQGQENWPGFRGGALAGVGQGVDLTQGEAAIRYKVAIPGKGWSSPVVWGDKIFLTTSVVDRPGPESRKGLYIQDLQGKVQAGKRTWEVLCLDFATGKQLWRTTVFDGEARGTIHIKNTYASETPCCDDKVVVAMFGNRGICALDHAGKVIWKQEIGPRKTEMGWGPAASPVLHDGVIYQAMDSEEESHLWAIDAATGKTKWKAQRKEKSNWASPFVWENSKGTEIITPGKGKIRGYSTGGEQLWELGGMSTISIPTPSAGKFGDEELVFVSSGYIMDIKKPVFAIRPGSRGDITPGLLGGLGEQIAWKQGMAGPYHPSPILLGKELHVLLDRGTLSCYQAVTGKAVWEKKSLGKGSMGFTASPVAAGGRLICLSEEGELFEVMLNDSPEVVQRIKLDEMLMATPAVANRSVLVRGEKSLFRLGGLAP